MAYTFKAEGMDELGRMLSKLGEAAHGVAAASLYEGAGVMADAVSQAVHGIATEPFHYVFNGRKRKPSPEEKALLESAPHGVTKFRKTGTDVSTSVGFSKSGYGELAGRKKPIPLIANSINSGTSFMEKQPFFRKAVAKNQKTALAAIENGINKAIEEMTK